MTTSQIIIAIISSSVISAVLTSIVNWKLHNSNYKKEYYKRILDKRLEAFEKVQDLTGKLNFQVQVDDYATPLICSSEEFYLGFIKLLASTIDSSFWLDSSTSTKLTELNVYFVNNITNYIDGNWSDEMQDKKYQELGNKHWEKIRVFRKELQSLINQELSNLHEIENFFKKRKSEKDITFEVYPPSYLKKDDSED